MEATIHGREAVRQALYEFAQRATDLIDRLAGQNNISPIEKLKLRALYTALKEDLRDAAYRGTVATAQEEQNLWEKDYFQPAMTDALKSLRARGNTNPITSHWLRYLHDSRLMLISYLDELDNSSI